MRGKLAKAIRKATRFHPADGRVYENAKHTERLTPTGRTNFDGTPEIIRLKVCTLVSAERRADYQRFKKNILQVKRRGVRHAA